MKRYKRYFEEENSTNNLTDIKLTENLINFIKENPFPKDEILHKFAEDNGYEPDLVEQYAYAFLTVIITGGKSKGNTSKITEDQLKIGLQIEKEHVELDKKYEDNKVIKAIQEIYETKISSDHYAENKTYYDQQLFKDELKKEA